MGCLLELLWFLFGEVIQAFVLALAAVIWEAVTGHPPAWERKLLG